MEQKIIESIQGNTQEVKRLRGEINAALEKYDLVKVKLWQPGIMYEQDNNWLTVVDFINEWHGKPVHFFSNLVPLKPIKGNLTYTNDMFISGHRLYLDNDLCRSIRKKLIKDRSQARPYHWDFLFGQHRNFKDDLYDVALEHEVSKKSLITYMPRGNAKWSHGHVPKVHTAETIGNDFSNPRISDLIDVDIYNDSYYSTIIETVIHNDFAMFSEKFAKPIMAKRPFVVFGSRHHLKAFRNLGFKTFDSVIDESYDDIEDMHKRFKAVLDTMQKLCELDPKKVFEELDAVLKHNFDHFLDTNWANL